MQAREGFNLGAGVVSQDTTGDLDGRNAYSISATKVALVGKVGSGNGLAWRTGYGFNEHFSIEALGATTPHTARHDSYTESSNATVTSLLLGARLNLPATDNLEVFGRIGHGSYSVVYDSHGLQGFMSGSTFFVRSNTDITFSGNGTGIGVGAELMLGKVGIELGLTQHLAVLKRVSGVGTHAGLDRNLNVSITAIDVVVSYCFR